MKIFYIARIFSGLEKSFITRRWKPSGVPTIYKIVEAMDERYDAKFVFCSKDSGKGVLSHWKEKRDTVINVEGLENQLMVIAGIHYFPNWIPENFRKYLREFRQIIISLKEVFCFKPDIVYCDNANVIVGAIVARFFRKTKVVYRLMGVYPSMRDALKSRTIPGLIYKWAYKSKFSLVICTQDGSGVERWIEDAIHQDTKVKILLNGLDSKKIQKIDKEINKTNTDKDKTILYVGKIETNKGCYDFLNATIMSIMSGKDNLNAIMIGSGSQLENVKKIVKQKNLTGKFTFLENVPHEDIYSYHHISYIYVSMNKLGNLSNANLEAINAEDCIIIPNPQNHGIDEYTREVLGEAVFYSDVNNSKKLSLLINQIIENPKLREKKISILRKQKKKLISSWEERVNNELITLEKISNE